MDNINRLQVRPPQEINAVKAKAVEDARKVQAQVIEECKKKGKDPPPYVLEELIGKGSFGRVYKGKDMKTAAIVAVKIIDIDESDTINPRNADAYADFLKEVNALRLLGESKAKNINLVMEALPVGKAMWMITEYCGGGSIATLMKPTPSGLNEKWIIPILREVAIALRYVHEAGIIHRDIKCANVLVTEKGDVQLCDFGVAGIVESKLDKRSTIVGTPHWMAPELFREKTTSYGKEIDIWAFGCMVYELATGAPPFARQFTVDQLGAALQHQVPRLEDTAENRYSTELKDLIAFCVQEDPKARPTIEEIQKHKYLVNTESAYPASSLRQLVGSFKVWEQRGGSRKSLFFQHGAQSSTPSAAPADDGWNFSTTAHFDLEMAQQYGVKDVIDVYGPNAVADFDEDTTRPSPRPPAKVSRRRPPPEALARPTAPLEKIFDPNTKTSYEANARAYYGLPPLPTEDQQSFSSQPPLTSDLPLRDHSAKASNRETLIDLDGPGHDTLRPSRPAYIDSDDDYPSYPDFNRPALSDPADANPNRHTVEWKFPSMAPPASADPELSRFPSSYDVPRPAMTPGSGGRPSLIHHPTEPLGAFGGGLQLHQPSMLPDRASKQSLIDLDMSMPDIIPEYRPSTANSDTGSTTSEHPPSANPFEFEKHASLYQPAPMGAREPSIYVTEDGPSSLELRNDKSLKGLADMSDFSASDTEGPSQDNSQYDEDGYYVVDPPTANGRRDPRSQPTSMDNRNAFDAAAMPPPSLPNIGAIPRDSAGARDWSNTAVPRLPAAPSESALSGTASMEDMSEEITRIMRSMSDQLSAFKDIYQNTNLVQKRVSVRRDPPRSTNGSG